MSPADVLKWAEVGSILVTQLGVPIVKIIQMFREQGGSEEQALDLIQKWALLHASVEARIAFLKAGIAALSPA